MGNNKQFMVLVQFVFPGASVPFCSASEYVIIFNLNNALVQIMSVRSCSSKCQNSNMSSECRKHIRNIQVTAFCRLQVAPVEATENM